MEEDEEVKVETSITRPSKESRFQKSFTARRARRFIKRIKAIKVARRERLQAEEIRKTLERKIHDED